MIPWAEREYGPSMSVDANLGLRHDPAAVHGHLFPAMSLWAGERQFDGVIRG